MTSVRRWRTHSETDEGRRPHRAGHREVPRGKPGDVVSLPNRRGGRGIDRRSPRRPAFGSCRRQLRRAYRASPSSPSAFLSCVPPFMALLMLSEALVTTFLMSLLAFLTASRTGVLRVGLAVAALEPWSLPAERTIVRPSPMTDFTAPMVWVIWSLVAASCRPTLRWLGLRSSPVTAGGAGSCDPTALRTCETR